VDIAAMLEHLRATARDLGLPFGPRRMTYNSRLAQELGKWAEINGAGEAFHRAVFRAYFVDGRNIGDPEILLDLAAAAGLDRRPAARALAERTHGPSVDADWRRCQERGVTAVPTFHMAGRVLVGAQPYPALRELLIVSGAALRGKG